MIRQGDEEKRRRGDKEKGNREQGKGNSNPMPNTQYPTLNTLYAAPWHRASFDRFLWDTLPQLLVSRVPLVGYRVEKAGEYTRAVTVEIGAGEQSLRVTFADVPQPDTDGVFVVNGREYVVLPVASSDELEQADIRCAGEQLQAFCAARLGEAPPELEWDENLLRAWLPLETWVADFVRLRGQALPQMPWEAEARWLERHTQLRRITLPEHRRMFTQGHFGRACPIETPEGPNVGRILLVATGATIRDGKWIVVDDSPLGNLGANARMLPFLEHNDPCRLVMAANMLRQWIVPPDPEPALIQTGSEPTDAPHFWCGRNLLTAYVASGINTFDDSILISHSCAQRLNYPFPIQPGDKMSNRYGNKGVVAQIVPDDEMPHLLEINEDGTEQRTPVELAFSPMSLHSRMTFGQVREAVLSCVAKAEGRPIVVPPFAAPDDAELQARIVAAGLPPSGMRTLTIDKNGPPMLAPSTVGWVYWGRLHHVAADKIHASSSPAHCSRIGQAEFHVLRMAGATENIRETFNTRAAARLDASTLAERLMAGPVEQSAPPAPQWADVARRLASGGIAAEFSEQGLAFHLSEPEGEVLQLAEPMPHPWNPETTLTRIGMFEELPEYGALADANARLTRMRAGQAPDSLLTQARGEQQTRLQAFFAVLLTPEHLEFSARTQFSGRAVATIGKNLSPNQVGLPEEIAWTLFAPFVIREMGGAEPVQARNAEAATVLDSVMARSWILLNRAPTLTSTGIIACRPVRTPGPAIQVHPFACGLLGLDFDGDLANVFLPVTAAAQKEAGEKLTIAGHLRREGDALPLLRPLHDAWLGLVFLARTPEGRGEIEQITGFAVAPENGLLTRGALEEPLRQRLRREGDAAIEPIVDILHTLTRRGFEVARMIGSGYGPFLGANWPAPPRPNSNAPEQWNAWLEEYAARIAERLRQPDALTDPVLLTLASGARGGMRLLLKVIGAQGVVSTLNGGTFTIRHGYREGLTPQEFLMNCIGAREGIAEGSMQWIAVQKEMLAAQSHTGYGVLARAMRALHPGLVFARAAAHQETDPLRDVGARLFVV